MIWLLTFWYLAPLAAAVPLVVIFLPATMLLIVFMAAPCITLYVAVASNGTLTRYLRITRLEQHTALSKIQRAKLRQCTINGFQQDPMACVDLMRGFSLQSNEDDKHKTSRNKVVPDGGLSHGGEITNENVKVSAKAKQRGGALRTAKSWKVSKTSKTALVGEGGYTAHRILTERHIDWRTVHGDNDVGHLLEGVKLQMFKVMMFGGFALVAYINLGFIGFYEHLDWSNALAEASESVQWPNFKVVFEFGFDLPRLFMLEFDWGVKLFFFFGVGLILIDEVIKRFRPCFYAFSFPAYQRIYDPESMASDEQESDLCSRLQEVQGGELCQQIIETARLAGGVAGRKVMLAMLCAGS
jgi:hypothetical protein